MIALRSYHWAAAAFLPTVFLSHAYLTPPTPRPCTPPVVDTPPMISAEGSGAPVNLPPHSLEGEVLEEGTGTWDGGAVIDDEDDAARPRAWSRGGVFWRWTTDLRAPGAWREALVELDDASVVRVEDVPYGVPTIARRGEGGTSWSFLPREVERHFDALRVDISARMRVVDDVAYVAYFPEYMARGCELYALDLATGEPRWRASLVGFEAQGWFSNRVQFEQIDEELHVFNERSDGADVWVVSPRDGEVLEARAMPSERWSRAGMVIQTSAARTTGKLAMYWDADDRLRLERASSPGDGALQVVGLDARDDVWRLALAGDELQAYHSSCPGDESVYILSYDHGRSGAMVTAIAPHSGEVRWASRLAGAGAHGLPVDRNLVSLEFRPTAPGGCVLRVEGHEGELGSYHEFVDAGTGATVASLRFLR